MKLLAAVRAGKVAEVKKLLTQGAKDFADSETGETPLGIAAESGNTQIVRILLNAGADPNYSRGAGVPLIAAAGAGHLSVVKLLMERGADVNAQGEGGDTALIAAAAAGHLGVVKAVIAGGARPQHCDEHGQSAVTVAADNGHRKVVEYLMPLSSDEDRSRVANRESIESQRVDPKDAERLVKAGSEGDLDQVRSLIGRGVPVDARCGEGQTALMLAANRDRVEVVDYLLGCDADPQLTDVYGECALTFALMGKARRSFDLLLPLSKSDQVVRARKALEHKRKYVPAYKGWRLPRVVEKAKQKR